MDRDGDVGARLGGGEEPEQGRPGDARRGHAGHCIAAALLVALIAPVGPAASADEPDLAAEISRLEGQLAADRDNVDVRLALASRLSWAGRWAEARRHALEVIERAPRYWDAHLLVARIDAWSKRFAAARIRVRAVLDAVPKNRDALALAADIAIWSADPVEAEAYAERLLAVDDSAAARYRRAQAAELNRRHRDARRWARRTLDLDPDHQGAAALLAEPWALSVTATTELEAFPTSNAFGQVILGTVFPRLRSAYTFGYEYRYRFGTHNHRLQLGIDQWISPALSASAFLRAGRTEVLADVVASGAVAYRWRHYTFTGRYRYDKMPWPGQLHRLFAGAAVGLPEGVELSARYFGGVLRHCGATDPAQGVELRGRVNRERFWASLLYGFGMELERAPLPGFLEERFGDDLCALAGDDGLELSDTRTQYAGLELGLSRPGRLDLRAGYTFQYRLSGDVVHVTFAGLRLWL